MNGPTIRRRIDGSARLTSNPSPRSLVRGRITVSITDPASRSANGSSGICQLIPHLQAEIWGHHTQFAMPPRRDGGLARICTDLGTPYATHRANSASTRRSGRADAELRMVSPDLDG